MKRVDRIIHRLLTALSLLLFLATAGVWVRSYWVGDRFDWYDQPADHAYVDHQEMYFARGGVRLTAIRILAEGLSMDGDPHFLYDRAPARVYAAFGVDLAALFAPLPHRYAALGFEWIPGTTTKWALSNDTTLKIQSLTIPLYFPCLIFALLPAHYFLRVRRRRRIAKRLAMGCCIACGYDMRATPGRCPECGREGATPSVSA